METFGAIWELLCGAVALLIIIGLLSEAIQHHLKETIGMICIVAWAFFMMEFAVWKLVLSFWVILGLWYFDDYRKKQKKE